MNEEATNIDPASDVVVDVQGLSKRFDIYPNDRARLREIIWGGKRHVEHWALRDVSFQIPRGHAFGVIGPNGAGKSSLLKVLSGVSPPTEGTVDIRASLNSLLDLGVGFHGDFSGRENCTLNCRLLGMSEDEIEHLVPPIIEFAELGEFIDLPVRTYSTGMNLRLGFAIAAHLNHEVLLIDELLSVGDTYFQRKCIRRIEGFIAEGRTLVLVSHDLHAVRELCSQAVWLNKGHVEGTGEARHVVDAYVDRARGRRLPAAASANIDRLDTAEAKPGGSVPLDYRATVPDRRLRETLLTATHLGDAEKLLSPAGEKAVPVQVGNPGNPTITGSGEAEVLAVQILDEKGEVITKTRTFEPVVIAVTFRTIEPVEDPIMGVAIFRNDQVYVFGPNTSFDRVEEMRGTFDGVYTYFIYYPQLPLLQGSYRLSVALYDKTHLRPHIWHNQLYELSVISDVEDHGLVHLEHHWGLVTHARGEEESLI